MDPSTPGPSSAFHQALARIPLFVRSIFYAIFFLGFILVLVPWLTYRLDVHVPAVHVEIGGWRVLGGAVFAAFLGIYLYCSYQLMSRGQGAYVEFDPPSRFVAEGPYRWVRNPIAACVVGMVFGLAIALSSTGLFLLAVAGIPIAHLQVVLLEEPLLQQRFGAAYDEYRRRVPRWIPRRPAREQP
jgi:protein-S-isoprenylcysteine O-methyltransferase Ste14